MIGPDSRDSYNILKNVMKTVDFNEKGIKFTFQHVPLPYHFYAYKIHQGKYVKISSFYLYSVTLWCLKDYGNDQLFIWSSRTVYRIDSYGV